MYSARISKSDEIRLRTEKKGYTKIKYKLNYLLIFHLIGPPPSKYQFLRVLDRGSIR